ncbi:MAG: hypothetical protein NXI30_25115 [bacterium]|nr:hypothetical protein [bacterium]
MRFNFLLLLGVASLSFALLPVGAARAQTTPLVFVESSFSCGGSFSNGVMQVDPTTGDRRILVGLVDDGGVCTSIGSGELPTFIYRLGWEPSTGSVLVADGNGLPSRLLRLSFPDGVGTVVSGCDTTSTGTCSGSVIGSGPLGTLLGDVVTITTATANPPALEAGDFVVGVSYSGCGFAAEGVLQIDPTTGDRTVLSGYDIDCQTISGAGDPFVEINGLFATRDGTLLVADGDSGIGRLIEVDPTTGNRTVLSGCETTSGGACIGSIVGSGPVPGFAHSVVPLDAGETTVASRMPHVGAPCFGGTVMEIDRATGDRAVLSGDDPTCAPIGVGDPFANLEALAALPSFDFVTSEDGGVDRIFRVDALTGARTPISGCTTWASLSCTGPTLGTGADANGYGVLTVPEPRVGHALWITIVAVVATSRGRRRPAPNE